MLYYVKNRSGNISDVTEEIYNRLKDKSDYEAWTEDPYEALPEEISFTSSDYTVKEALELAKDMDEDELDAFLEGETRKTLTRL